jgi:hypothetical protein
MQRSTICRLWRAGMPLGVASVFVTCHLDQLFNPMVLGKLFVSPSRIAESVAQGSTAPKHRTLTVHGSSAGLSWRAAVVGGSGWLQLGQTEDTVPSNLDVTLNPGGLAEGEYLDTIVVTSAGSDGVVSRVPVTFVVQSVPPPPPPPPPTPRRLALVTQPTSTVVGGTIAPPVRVAALDSAGSTVTGFTGRITLAIGSNPTGGTLRGTTGVDAVNGVATFGDLSIDKEGAAYTLAASSNGLAGETSDAFDVLGAGGGTSATHLWFTDQPTPTPGGQPITPPVRVEAHDAQGRVVTDYTGAVTMSIGRNPSCGILSGTRTVPAVNGVAIFRDLNIDKGGQGYTLVAGAAGLTEATSWAFPVNTNGVVGCGTPTHLVIVVQPRDTRIGSSITPAIRVAAHDNSGNIAGGFTGNITMAISANPSGGTLLGTTTLQAVNGVVTFSDLQIDKLGQGYTLVARAAGLTEILTYVFNIVP